MALPELYKFQKQDLSYWWKTLEGRGILGWSCGLGKTFCAARVTRYYRLQGKTVLISTTKSLVNDWIDNVKNLNVDITKFEIKTKTKNKEKFKSIEGISDCTITTHDMLKKMPSKNYDLMIIDECHYMKGLTTDRAKAMISFAQSSKHLLMMSGTLSQQRDQIELFPYLKAINNEDIVLPRNKTQYQKEWCLKEEKYNRDYKYPVYTTLPEFAKKMDKYIKYFTTFRRAEDVLDLPEYIDSKITVESTLDFSKFAEELQSEIDFTVSGTYQTPHIAHALQLANGYDFINEKYTNFLKFEAISELLDSLHKTEQVLIWTYWTTFSKELKKYLDKNKYDSQMIIGDTPDKARQKYINDFKSGKTRIIIASQGTISEGQNLQNCRYSIFANVWYDSTKYEQCKARTYRNGQKRTTFNYTIVGKDSLEEEALKVLKQKLSLREAEDYFNTILTLRLKGKNNARQYKLSL